MSLHEDIISSLISRGSYHPILINVLIHLDNDSLVNVACVCKLWSEFMQKYVHNSQQFRDKRLELHFKTCEPSVWVIAAGQFVSCMTWDSDIVVVGRAQSGTYTQDTGHGMVSPLVFVYSRPSLDKSLSLYGHRLGVTCLGLDGQVIVSGSVDCSVRVWCRRTGAVLACLRDHIDWVTGLHVMTLSSDQSTLFSMGLDMTIHCYNVNHPNVLEDFDSTTTVTEDKRLLRSIEDDESFVQPRNYKQPLKTYLKQCGCIVSSTQYLIVGFKTLIHVWKLGETQVISTLKGHQELVGELKVINNMLVSSGCDKRVCMWSLDTMTCLHVLSYKDKFNNVSYPKIALDHRYLLITTSDHIDIWATPTLTTQPQKLRSLPVQELTVDIHLEKRGLAFSCYKSVYIMDFENPDNHGDSLFYGTKTNY